jgi:hypothetical protein
MLIASYALAARVKVARIVLRLRCAVSAAVRYHAAASAPVVRPVRPETHPDAQFQSTIRPGLPHVKVAGYRIFCGREL